MNAMRTSPHGREKIRGFEGFSASAYPDPGTGDEPWTIGYGHTKGVKPGDVITRQKADLLLIEDLKDAERAVNELVTVDLTQDQFDALVSFTFNVGRGALAKSQLLKKLNAGNHDAVPAELKKWVNAGGKRMPGLVTRRTAEAGMWVRGQFAASASVEVEPVKPKAVTPQKMGLLSTTAGVATDGASQLSMFAEYSDVIRWVVVALVVGGIGLTVWGIWRANKDALA